MSNVDELCVKYVFDELDPSEITLVEQAMHHDQNLLIEIESLKSTWRKLKKLPEMSPPEDISKAVLDQAREYSNQQQLFGTQWNNPGLLATAAIVLFSLMISTAYLLPGDNSKSADDVQASGEMNRAGTSGGSVVAIENPDMHSLFDFKAHQRNLLYPVESDNEPAAADTLLRDHTESDISNVQTPIMSPVFRDFHLTGTGQ